MVKRVTAKPSLTVLGVFSISISVKVKGPHHDLDAYTHQRLFTAAATQQDVANANTFRTPFARIMRRGRTPRKDPSKDKALNFEDVGRKGRYVVRYDTLKDVLYAISDLFTCDLDGLALS